VLLLIVGLPCSAIGALIRPNLERRRRRRLEAQGRYLPLEELQRHLLNGEGTMIVEFSMKGPQPSWWSPEDIVSTYLEEMSPDATGGVLVFCPSAQGYEPRCFRGWSPRQFFDVRNGSAYLTEWPPEVVDIMTDRGAEEFHRAYPAINVIVH
jgi:hypothetical protein